MRPRSALGAGTIALVGVALTVTEIRRRSLRWGASAEEQQQLMPGDEFTARADLESTRAVSIQAGAEQVWPWIAQLGQDRGGLYSYDWLENLIGCDMHSADVLLPQFQEVAVGDQIRLAPQMPLTVARVDHGRVLVLVGGVPLGAVASPFEFSWAFALMDGLDGSTRLVVRERYKYVRPWAAMIVEPTELISFVMSNKMLRGIKQRAERAAAVSQGMSTS